MNQSRTCPINLEWEWLSSQAVCHSFIPALLGMMIGSQSTSNRWIGAQLGWLSGAAVYARVQSVASGGARPCMLTLYARWFLWTTAHLCYSISHLIGILSFLNHHRCCRARSLPCSLPGCRAERRSSRQVFLIFAIKLLSQRSWKYFCGNKHSWRHNKSGGSERWGIIWEALKRCSLIVTQQEIFVREMASC